MISFFVQGQPRTKGSFRSFKSQTTGKQVVLNTQAETTPWQTTIGWVAQAHKPPRVWEGPVKMILTVFFVRPKKPKFLWPTKSPDADKALRSVGDALQGIFYKNDAQIVDCHVRKAYGFHPGVLIEVEEAQP